jgi:hypothetical protein
MSVEHAGYTAEVLNSRTYGDDYHGRTKFFYVVVTDPSGVRHVDFDPWQGFHAPQYFLLECMGTVMQRQRQFVLAREVTMKAIKQARAENDKKHLTHALSLIEAQIPIPLETNRRYEFVLEDHGDEEDYRTSEQLTARIIVYRGNISIEFFSTRENGPQWGEIYAELYHGELAVNLYDAEHVGGDGTRLTLAEPDMETLDNPDLTPEEIHAA